VLEAWGPTLDRLAVLQFLQNAEGLRVLELDEHESVGLSVAAGGIADEIAEEVQFAGYLVGCFHGGIHIAQGGAEVTPLLEERRDLVTLLAMPRIRQKSFEFVEFCRQLRQVEPDGREALRPPGSNRRSA
jgi:hypothetical protein